MEIMLLEGEELVCVGHQAWHVDDEMYRFYRVYCVENSLILGSRLLLMPCTWKGLDGIVFFASRITVV